MQYKIGLFEKTECLVKTVKKVFFEKTECLANTYKSGSLRDKLPKRTMYIVGTRFSNGPTITLGSHVKDPSQ